MGKTEEVPPSSAYLDFCMSGFVIEQWNVMIVMGGFSRDLVLSMRHIKIIFTSFCIWFIDNCEWIVS